MVAVIKMFFKGKGSSFDYLIVGLGNPGIQYENTRHNAGFMVADALAKKCGMTFSRNKHEAVFGDTIIEDRRVIIAKPQTYMNLSGRAVMAIANFYKIPLDKIIIVFDDISLDVGKIRLRRKGSAGGHNGMKDIIALSGSEDIMRVKVGVGSKPHADYDLKDWVLGKIPVEQAEDFNKACDTAVKAIEEIIKRGIDSAMNNYSK